MSDFGSALLDEYRWRGMAGDIARYNYKGGWHPKGAWWQVADIHAIWQYRRPPIRNYRDPD